MPGISHSVTKGSRIPTGMEHSALKESKLTRGLSENRKGFLEEELVGKMQRRAQIEEGKPVLCPLHSSGSLMAFNCAYPPLAGDFSIFFLGAGGGKGAGSGPLSFSDASIYPRQLI